MLRRIRVRLRPSQPDLSRRISLRSSSAVAYKVREEDHQLEPYGTEYGAGPSRLPYQPSLRLPLAIQARFSAASHVSAHEAARVLRQRLDQLLSGAYSQPGPFLRKALKLEGSQAELRDMLPSLSRLELHTIVNHLIRRRQGNIAVSLVWEAISLTPRLGRRRLFARQTIAALLHHRKNFRLPRLHIPAQPPPTLSPDLADQTPSPPSPMLGTMLNILEALQDVRFHRTAQMYRQVIRQCLDELQPDLAAKVYVGLVEEWVTEGRVAEGADPEDFHPGGGPPREEILHRKRISEMLKRWWTGVRTWRLPGEVLSPHDRLDLWHPRHLSLGEKMRNFPFPLATSPPSIVPQPDARMLNMILASLKLDPAQTSPAHLASSMRALAILANTVLSRTLPIPALGGLLQAFNSVPYKPDVFPDNVTIRPENNAWAYTAFTQIHVTLMSLLFSPPMSADSIRMLEAHHRQHSPPDKIDGDAYNADVAIEVAPKSSESKAQPVSPYMLPPLSWSSCRIILLYAMRSLREPVIIRRLMEYMKKTFALGGTNPMVYNVILQCSSLMRDNALARRAEAILFGPPQVPVPARKDDRAFFSARRIEATMQPIGDLDIDPVESNGPVPDEQSLLQLLKHLVVTSQFDRFVDYVYRLIPFLEFSEDMSPETVAEKVQDNGLTVGFSNRPVSDPLTPDVYAAILHGLEKAGRTGLAQRVFSIALHAEDQLVDKFIQKRSEVTDMPEPAFSSGDVPCKLTLPIGVFTTILSVWENEYSSAIRSRADGRRYARVGWIVPREIEDLPVDVQACQMALSTHHLVQERLRRGMFPKLNKRDLELYYDTLLVALRGRWGLDGKRNVGVVLASQEMTELQRCMRRDGVGVPEIVQKRLEGDMSGRLERCRRSCERQVTESAEDADEAPAVLLRRMMGRS